MTATSGEAVRSRICRYLRDHPGAHFRGLQRALGLSPGQTAHHLRHLARHGLVVGDDAAGDGQVHYFVHGVPRGPRRVQASLRHPVRQRLVQALRRLGPLTIRELVAHTGHPASTVHHHLRVLARVGAVAPLPGTWPMRHGLAPSAVAALGEPEPRDGPDGPGADGVVLAA